jgi:hypothetical protein
VTSASLTAIARHFLFVREVGAPNDGAWVSFMQRRTGNSPGDSWCASFVCLVLDIAYRSLTPLVRSASCQVLLDDARRHGFVLPAGTPPAVDDLFFYVNDEGHAHHVGIVTGVSPLTGIAGNTSEDGRSSNGTGVFEHPINASVFVRLPKGIL